MNVPPPSPVFTHVGQIEKWPAFLPKLLDISLLEHVWVQALESDTSGDGVRARTQILIQREMVLSIPGLDAVALVIPAESGGTVIPVDLEIVPQLFIRVMDVPLSLRLKSDFFKPVRRIGTSRPGQLLQFEIDPDKTSVDIQLARATVEINADGGISLQNTGGIDLPACMLGESNIVIEAKGIGLHLDPDNPPRANQ